MIIGIGVDLAEVARFQRMLRRPRHVLAQAFSPVELELCRTAEEPAAQLAAAFVVKEAVFKALGCGWLDSDIFWLDVELLTPLSSIQPGIRLRGAAAEMLQVRGGTRVVGALCRRDGLILGQIMLLGGGLGRRRSSHWPLAGTRTATKDVGPGSGSQTPALEGGGGLSGLSGCMGGRRDE